MVVIPGHVLIAVEAGRRRERGQPGAVRKPVLAVRPEVGVGPHLPDIVGRVAAGRISYRNRIRPLGKWTSWTVLRLLEAAQDGPVEQGLGARVVALADQP